MKTEAKSNRTRQSKTKQNQCHDQQLFLRIVQYDVLRNTILLPLILDNKTQPKNAGLDTTTGSNNITITRSILLSKNCRMSNVTLFSFLLPKQWSKLVPKSKAFLHSRGRRIFSFRSSHSLHFPGHHTMASISLGRVRRRMQPLNRGPRSHGQYHKDPFSQQAPNCCRMKISHKII